MFQMPKHSQMHKEKFLELEIQKWCLSEKTFESVPEEVRIQNESEVHFQIQCAL